MTAYDRSGTRVVRAYEYQDLFRQWRIMRYGHGVDAWVYTRRLHRGPFERCRTWGEEVYAKRGRNVSLLPVHSIVRAPFGSSISSSCG